MSGASNATFTLEFFSNEDIDWLTGNGEGEIISAPPSSPPARTGAG